MLIKQTKYSLIFYVLLAFSNIQTAVAGTPCEEVTTSADTMQQAVSLSAKVVEKLNSTNDKVVLLARVGQDLSKYNLRFSHLGFVVRDHPSGQWSVVHDLNLCGTDKSQLFIQGIANFYSDDMFAYEAGIMFIPMNVQLRLEKILNSTTQVKRFHEPKYSVVSYPFSTIYQNSNQWALETLASAMAPEGDIATRIEAQNWLRKEGYDPTLLNIPALTRLGGRMFKANVAFNDHPDEYRYDGKIYAVTVDSVFNFMLKSYPNETTTILLKN